MTVAALEGPAGSGKTHRLMEELQQHLQRRPLQNHQRVLALTFMHGSRRRLDARLGEIEGGHGRWFEAATVDSFAWRIVQRWRALARARGYEIPGERQYNQTCALGAALLERPEVRSWVAATCPVVIIDEAQDLNDARSRMIAALARKCDVFLAFDDFQCLNLALLPIAVREWLGEHCEPATLTGCRRTDDAELIEAALALREGRDLQLEGGRRFKVAVRDGRAPYFTAAATLANAIRWRGDDGSFAFLTPSRQGGFADTLVDLVSSRSIGRHNSGPYRIAWENTEEANAARLWDELEFPDRCSVAEALAFLESHRGEPALRAVREWLRRQQNTIGMEEISAAEARRYFDRVTAQRRRFGAQREPTYTAMTIQQAKNREFDHVVVAWPFAVRDDDEQKRRLLYNAITRARRSCMVLVQAQRLVETPPFVAMADG
ncbi:ATP-dependent helicase [Nitratireductor sp. GCM10026969]|uniref:ATP-dependent helicase n=1 Tax=Nitratireductor sp. GCM10026969 TaxID=3252645 RepID=UPI003615D5C0